MKVGTDHDQDAWPWVIDNRRFAIAISSVSTAACFGVICLDVLAGFDRESWNLSLLMGVLGTLMWFPLILRAGVWRITPTAILYLPLLGKPRWIAFTDVTAVSLNLCLSLHTSPRLSTPVLSPKGKIDARRRERLLATWLDEWFDMSPYFDPPTISPKPVKRVLVEWFVGLLVVVAPMFVIWRIGINDPGRTQLAMATMLLWPALVAAAVLLATSLGLLRFESVARHYQRRQVSGETQTVVDVAGAMKHVRYCIVFGDLWTLAGGFNLLWTLAVAVYFPNIPWTVLAILFGVLFWVMTVAWVSSAWRWWRWASAISQR